MQDNRRFIIALCMLWVSATVMAIVPTSVLRLWEDGAPTSNGFEQQPEQGDSIHSFFVSEPTLTIYLPEHPNGLAILDLPGGGYWDVWHGTEGHNLAEWLTGQGVTLAVLKYRLPNGHHEVPLEDVHRAMTMLRARADKYGITQLGVMGFSAGGHLASTAATHYAEDYLRPDFQILFYPVITMDKSFTHMGSRVNLLGSHPRAKLVRLYSNELQVTADTPPAFIVASTDDGLVPVQNSLSYYDALIAHGVEASLHLYPVGGHGWCAHTWFPYREQWMHELEMWLSWLIKR